MKTKSTLLTFLLVAILTNLLFSQTDSIKTGSPASAMKMTDKFNYKKSTAINVLYAIPVGEFGKKSDEGGYANPGWGVSFDSRNHLALGFSLVSYSSYCWINLDSKAMSERMTSDLGLRTVVDGGQHRPFFTTLGLSKHFYVTPGVQVGVSATVGVLYNSFKAFQLTIYNTNEDVIYSDYLRFDSDFAFAYGFSSDINVFLIKDILALHFEARYNTAKTDTYLRSNYFDPIKTYQKMQFFNLNLGMVFFSK